MDIRDIMATAPMNTHHTVMRSILFLHISFMDSRTERFAFACVASLGISTTTVSLHFHAHSQKQGSITTEHTRVVQKYPFAVATSLFQKNRIMGMTTAERMILITDAPMARQEV